METKAENDYSLFRYSWSSKTDLLDLLESEPFLEFVECVYQDLVKFYEMTNGPGGEITADALNTCLSYSGAVRHELTLFYEVVKELERRDHDAFEDFKDGKEIEIRKRENTSGLAASKWLSIKEIEKWAKMENFEEYKTLRYLKNASHNKCRFILKMLTNLGLRTEELKTISSNARTEMNNLNIDAFALSLEDRALKDIQEKTKTLKTNKRRERRLNKNV